MSRQGTTGLILHGLAFLAVLTYAIGCFQRSDLRIEWISSIANSDKDSQKYLNYYRSSEWKTDQELSGKPVQKHEHGAICTLLLLAAIAMPITAMSHSAIILICSKWGREELKKFGDVIQEGIRYC